MIARGVMNFSKNLDKEVESVPSSIFHQAQSYWDNRFKEIRKMNGKENPFKLHQELGDIMLANVLIVRDNKGLEKAVYAIEDIQKRFQDVKCVDTQDWANPVPSFINQLSCMIELSKVVTKGALMRDEFRGAHYKPEFDLKQPANFDPHEYIDYLEQKNYGEVSKESFPAEHLDYMKRFEENNKKWLKTTIAEHKNGKPEISYEEINTVLVTPRPRKYD